MPFSLRHIKKARPLNKALLALFFIFLLGLIFIVADVPGRIHEFISFRSAKPKVHKAFGTNQQAIFQQLSALGLKQQYNPAYCEHSGGTETRETGYCTELIQYDTKITLTAAQANAIISKLDKFFLGTGWTTTDFNGSSTYEKNSGTFYTIRYEKSYPDGVKCYIEGNLGAGSPEAFTTYSCYSKSLDLGSR